MLKQQSFSSLAYANKKKRTKREVFLGEMEAVVPWRCGDSNRNVLRGSPSAPETLFGSHGWQEPGGLTREACAGARRATKPAFSPWPHSVPCVAL